MAETMRQIEELEVLHNRWAEKREMFLRRQGWELSCTNPSSVWYWIKVIDGYRFTLNASDAVSFEERLAEIAEAERAR